MSSIAPDVQAAIIAARQNPANATYFATHPSDYLVAAVKSGVVDVQGLNTIASTPIAFAHKSNQDFLQNILNAVPKTYNGNNSQGPNTNQQNQMPDSNPTRNLGDSFKSGLSQAGTFFKQNPIYLVGAFALLALMVVKK